MTDNVTDAIEPVAIPKRRRWGRNQFIAAGTAVLLLIGGGAWAYSAYQAPSTVIGMAIGSVFGQQNPSLDATITASGDALQGADGSLTLHVSTSSAGADVKAVLDLALAGQKAGATIESITAKSGDVYFAFSHFDTLLSLVEGLGVLPSGSTSSLTSFVGKWVKLSKTEIDSLSGSAGSVATCLQDKLKDSAHAEAARTEMINLAKAHQFLIVAKELGTQNGSVGYNLSIDLPQLKAFLAGFIDTKTFDDYTKCAGATSALPAKAEVLKTIDSLKATDFAAAMKGVTISLWADQFSHKLTKYSIDIKQPTLDVAVEVKPGGDRSDQVKIPTETISVAQLQSMLAGISAGQ